MRNVLLLGTVLMAGCSMQPPSPAKVSWQYGAGNGDGVAYPGPKPIFQRAYGPGNGDGVTSGQAATENYGYGGDGQTSTMVQVAPESRQMMAAPTPTATTPQAVPGTHS